MTSTDHVVFVVDDDYRIREALSELLLSQGVHALTFRSAVEYIECPKPDLPACLILDVQLPDISGLDLQKKLASTPHPPIVFITGYGDIPSSVGAIKAGAVDFLTKPLRQRELVEAIHAALALDRKARKERHDRTRLQQCYSRLTPREREVLPLVISGLLNKQSAAELGISEITFQIHRGKIMRKMEAASFAELVRIAGQLQIPFTLYSAS